MPPLSWNKQAEYLPCTEEYMEKYRDLAKIKSGIRVYIEESAEDREDTLRYTLMVRCVFSDADLRIIVKAAKHLGMLDHYRIVRGYVENLDGSLEKNYAEICCDCGTSLHQIDEDRVEQLPIYITANERKAIWMGLFQAAGYNVTWGKVLNVKKYYL